MIDQLLIDHPYAIMIGFVVCVVIAVYLYMNLLVVIDRLIEMIKTKIKSTSERDKSPRQFQKFSDTKDHYGKSNRNL